MILLSPRLKRGGCRRNSVVMTTFTLQFINISKNAKKPKDVEGNLKKVEERSGASAA